MITRVYIHANKLTYIWPEKHSLSDSLLPTQCYILDGHFSPTRRENMFTLDSACHQFWNKWSILQMLSFYENQQVLISGGSRGTHQDIARSSIWHCRVSTKHTSRDKSEEEIVSIVGHLTMKHIITGCIDLGEMRHGI